MNPYHVRNEKIFNVTSISPLAAKDLVQSQIREYSLAIAPIRDKSSTIPKESSPTAWSPPPSGYTKLNFDAAYMDQDGSGGIGLILRNKTGLFLAAKAIHISHCLNARTTEALAAREALHRASEIHLSHLIIESNSYGVIKLIDSNQPLPPDNEVIILDCRRFKQQLQDICFSFTLRTGNCSAHIVAKHSRSINGKTLWTSCPPSWLINSLKGDMGFC
ncbi:hypothetical protein RJ640_005382 [Escallonia rubra]|uniref:RNase H type-1 domain-containing protein n=1 Tax=Escallonia rubra TaxID=112253 RepID=A0AA88RK61_9ASTE|nr:hypothetical protein RJ640_005382 [Escallonia rubra]